MNFIFSEVKLFLLNNSDILTIKPVINSALPGNPLRALYGNPLRALYSM